MKITSSISQGISSFYTQVTHSRFKWVFPFALFALGYTAYRLWPLRVQRDPPPSNTPAKSPVSLEGEFDADGLTSILDIKLPEDSPLNEYVKFEGVIFDELDDWSRAYEEGVVYNHSDAIDRGIVERLDLYNKTLRLRDRLCAMKDQTHIKITVEDIELPWQESGLRVALLTDLEVEQLTSEAIRKMSERQLNLLKVRMSHGATIPGLKSIDFSENGPITNTILEEIAGITEQLIGYLNSQQIIDLLNRNLLDPSIAHLITADQVREIDFRKVKKLESEVIQCLFFDETKIPSIQVESVRLLLPLIPAHTLKYLTQEQVQVIDFEKDEMDQTRFTQMLAPIHLGWGQPARYLIHYMSSTQIFHALNRSLFYHYSLGFISDSQLQDLDLNLITDPMTKSDLERRKRKPF